MISSLSSFSCIIKPFGRHRVRKYPALVIVSQRFDDEGNSRKNFVDANLRVLTKRIEALRRKEKAYDEGWSCIKRGYDHQKHKHGKINDMLSASTEVLKLFVSGIVLALITCSLSLFLVSLVIRMFTL